MITGMHSIMYSKNADAIRTFFRDVLGYPSVDAGHGWLIFALPPAELAMHPTDGADAFELFLMCDDLDATLADLESKSVKRTRPVSDEQWGRVTAIAIADGSELALYEPRHPVAIHTSSNPSSQ